MEVLLKLPMVMWPWALPVLLVHSALIRLDERVEPPADPEG